MPNKPSKILIQNCLADGWLSESTISYRKNVFVFSTINFILFYLGAPVNKASFLGFELSNIDLEKLKIFFQCILLYFLLLFLLNGISEIIKLICNSYDMVIEAQKDSPLPNKDATYEDIYDFKKIEGYFKLLTKISILSMVLLGLKILLEF